MYTKFQNPSAQRSKVSIFTEKSKNQSKFQNSVLLSKFNGKFSKVNQVINFSAPTIIPNMNALAQLLFEISCTHDFKILFSKGHYSEKGHNSDMKKKKKKKKKKIRVNFFFMRNLYTKFQIPSMHPSTHPHLPPPPHHTHTDKPKAICPSNFFKVGGIINKNKTEILSEQ